MKEIDRWCNVCKNYGNGLCKECADLKYHEFIEEYYCEYFYKGYCSKYEDGCFRQCQKEPERPKWKA